MCLWEVFDETLGHIPDRKRASIVARWPVEDGQLPDTTAP
jgi:hypothetical protein